MQGVMKNSASLSHRFNKLWNLALQGVAELSEMPAELTFPSTHYIEIGNGPPLLRKEGKAEPLPAIHETLADLSQREDIDALDFVFVENSCIDLEFGLPDALLPELRQIIENEIQYRSPFNDGSSYASWTAEEQADGRWRARAAVFLKTPIDELLTLLSDNNLKPGIVRHVSPKRTFSARPAWAGHVQNVKRYTALRNTSVPFKLCLVGALLFCGSAIASSVHSGITHARLSTDVDVASNEIATLAQEGVRIRNIDRALNLSSDKMAMTGLLSALLPDDVWLIQLIIDEDSVTLVGSAPSAADVTRLLTNLPELTDVHFASPVTRDNQQSTERFRIAATLTGASQ